MVCEDVVVSENVLVYGDMVVCEDLMVYGDVVVCEDAALSSLPSASCSQSLIKLQEHF